MLGLWVQRMLSLSYDLPYRPGCELARNVDPAITHTLSLTLSHTLYLFHTNLLYRSVCQLAPNFDLAINL